METKKIAIILTSLFVVAFVLRWYLMPGHLFFGPEQGRDFLVIQDIAERHKLTLIGSKTDVAGIFHGPVYYYIAALPYLISRGDPGFVLAFFIALQCASVFLIYTLLLALTKKKRAGIIGAVVFTVSFLFIVYSRWLSNPPLSIPLSLVFMICLTRFVRGRQPYLLAVAFLFGLLGQAEFINFLLFGVIGALVFITNREKIRKTNLFMAGAALVVWLVTSFATYILFDLRHESIVRSGVIDLLLGKSSYQVTLLVSALGAFRVLLEQIAKTVGLSGWIAGVVVAVTVAGIIFKRFKRDFPICIPVIWIMAPPVIFALLRHGMLDQLYAGVIAGIIIFLAIAVDLLWEKSKALGVFVLAIYIGLNGLAVLKNLPNNHEVFFQPQQPMVRYSDQLAVINWVYMTASGKPFSFQAYTIPYFLQDAWTYLFGYYGQRKYGYLPDTLGRQLQYVVIQSDSLDPNFQKKWYAEATSSWGKRTAQTQIGDFTIEEWTL